MAAFADGAKVAKLHQRIGGRLQKYQASVLLQCALDVVDIGGIDVGKRQTKVSQHLIEQARRSSVEIVSGDHVVARFEHGSHSIDRRHPAGENLSGNAAFESSEVRLQPVTSRVR